jgi:hypothetical protein
MHAQKPSPFAPYVRPLKPKALCAMPMEAQGLNERACRLQIHWPLAPKPSLRATAPIRRLARLFWCLEKPAAEAALKMSIVRLTASSRNVRSQSSHSSRSACSPSRLTCGGRPSFEHGQRIHFENDGHQVHVLLGARAGSPQHQPKPHGC